MSTAAAKPKSLFKRIVVYTLVVLMSLFGVLCVVAAMQPSNFRYSRAATFKATPAAVFEQVNDFHKWGAWSPWAKKDPNAKETIDGATSGQGAKLAWDGNSDVGAGNMEIVESKPNDLVRIRMHFIRPMEGDCDIDLKIEPAADQSKLIWTMSGENGFVGKMFGLFIDCEKMCCDDFDKALANIKAIVESPPVRAEGTEAAKPAGEEPAKPSDS